MNIHASIFFLGIELDYIYQPPLLLGAAQDCVLSIEYEKCDVHHFEAQPQQTLLCNHPSHSLFSTRMERIQILRGVQSYKME